MQVATIIVMIEDTRNPQKATDGPPAPTAREKTTTMLLSAPTSVNPQAKFEIRPNPRLRTDLSTIFVERYWHGNIIRASSKV
jgi:hypothetical protein